MEKNISQKAEEMGGRSIARRLSFVLWHKEMRRWGRGEGGEGMASWVGGWVGERGGKEHHVTRK